MADDKKEIKRLINEYASGRKKVFEYASKRH